MCHSQFGTEDEPITVNHLETPSLVVTSHNWLKRAVFSWVATLQRDFCEAPGKFPLSQARTQRRQSSWTAALRGQSQLRTAQDSLVLYNGSRLAVIKHSTG